MALQVSRTTEFGITLPAAYVRIVAFTGDNDVITVTYFIHANAAARTNGDMPIEKGEITVTTPDAIASGGIIHWCYNQIKVLPEFDGYIDV